MRQETWLFVFILADVVLGVVNLCVLLRKKQGPSRKRPKARHLTAKEYATVPLDDADDWQDLDLTSDDI